LVLLVLAERRTGDGADHFKGFYDAAAAAWKYDRHSCLSIPAPLHTQRARTVT
jgi:hypothetical protein